uniref:FA complementation group C n=1 Tax=Xiphophorus couchianus TaxID=32473 RepID=A0A3B5L8Q3_9TELE
KQGLVETNQMPFWLEKAIAWGQTDTPHTRNDISLHLKRLRDFLQHIQQFSSTTETLNRLPLLGQLLGRLCWNSHVTAEGESILWKIGKCCMCFCLLALYSEHPSNAVERKANQWIQKVLCHLATDEEDGAALGLMKHLGVPTKEYHLKVLKKVFCFYSFCLKAYLCSCGSIWAVSEACVPLITCPEASPLIGALLQQQMTCIRESLSENFLDALHSAYSRYRKCFYCIFSLCFFFFPEMPQESLKNHLIWVSSSLQRLTEEEEDEEDSDIFEAWFLLVQCGYWVQMVVQLLVTSGPEDCGPLLWLLTFYHHPTNRWHHRASQLVQAKAAWDHLYSLFSIVAHLLPADHLQSFISLLAPKPQQPSLAPSLTLNLLVNFATFGQLPQSISAEITQKVSKLSSLKPLHSASHLSCYHKI